jgi:phage terminase Nu1 subunit (DNA packaging protein)
MKISRSGRRSGQRRSKIVDVKVLSEALNLTPRRIQQLAKEGLPKLGRGRYSLRKCQMWYIRYLQKRLEKELSVSADGKELGLVAVRLRRESAIASLREIDLANARRTLIAIEDVDKVLDDIVRSARKIFLDIPRKMSSMLVGIDASHLAQSILERHLNEALRRLAKA